MAGIVTPNGIATVPETSFNKALRKFRDTLTDEQKQRFRGTKLEDVNSEIQDIQARFGPEKKLRNLNRISKFVEAMTQLEEVVKVFLNVSEVVAFVWGPIKLALVVASARVDTLDCLLETYVDVGENIPRLKEYDQLFRSFPSVREILEKYFYDVLEFHRKALDVFMRPAWETVWRSTWKTFQTDFKPILSSLKRHRELLLDEKMTAAIIEIQSVHQLAKHGFGEQSTQTDDRFAALSQQIRTLKDLFYDNQKRLNEKAVTEQQEALDQKKSFVMEKLDPPKYEVTQHRAFDQRFAKSGDWILESEIFLNWVHGSETPNNTLYVHGIPGAGKTTLVSRIVEFLRSHQTTLKGRLLFFYFKQHEDSEDSTVRMLRAILAQLLDQDTTLIDYFYQRLCSVSTGDLRALHVLKGLAEESLQSQQRCILILDGLDECGNESRSIIEWLHNTILPNCHDKGSRMNLLLAGQRDGILDQYFTSYSNINLDSTKSHIKDIEKYTLCRARTIRERFSSDEKIEAKIVEKVILASSGMFLYAKVVLDNLMSQGSPSEFENELKTENFPDGLDRAYDRVAIRIFERAPRPQRNAAAIILGIVVCAFRPLRWREIQSRFCIDPTKGLCDYNNRRVDSCKALCGSFVEAERCTWPNASEPVATKAEMVIRLVHDTAGKYLMHTGRIRLHDEHTKMAIFCSRYLMSGPLKHSLEETAIRNFALSGYYGLLDYAAAFWHHHIHEALDLARKYPIEFPQDFIVSTIGLLENSYPTQGAENLTSGTLCTQQIQQIRQRLQEWYDKGDKSLLKKEISTIRRVIEAVYFEGIDDAKFEMLVALTGVVRFKCPKPQCDWFVTGFTDRESRDMHSKLHERVFKCPNEHCPANRIGFISHGALNSHIKRSHPDTTSTELLFPPSNKRNVNIFNACAKGNIDAVMRYIHDGGDIKMVVERKHRELLTPLAVAARNGQILVCRYLVQQGAQIFNPDKAPVVTNTALGIAIGNDDYDLVCVLLERIDTLELNSPGNRGRTPLQLAIANGNEAIINLLLATKEVDIDYKDGQGGTLLSYAAKQGNGQAFGLLLATGKFDVDAKDKLGLTPLSLAAKSGCETAVEMLLMTDEVDVDAKDNCGQTPLIYAASRGHETVVRMLLATRKVNVNWKDYEKQWTPLSWAAERGFDSTVKLLLDNDNVDVDSKDKYGQTPLLLASNQGHQNVFKMILETGKVDVDVQDNTFGWTPFLWAASRGHEAIVKLLLGTGRINVNSKNIHNGQTPLIWAARNGYTAVVKMLLETNEVNIGSRDSLKHRQPLMWAIESGHETIVKLLLDTNRFDVNDREATTGLTPFMRAAFDGHEKIVKLLLETGKVNIKLKDNIGNGLLERFLVEKNSAIYKDGYDKVYRLLLEAGAK